jgi:Reverse transcriptase (RNA-dependent DNA polymerase)
VTEAWRLSDADLKRYPHFDPVITAEEGEALANAPVRVAKHTFYPFMHYDQRWTRFGKKGNKGKSKTRLIRYASRSDAYILSRYRFTLSEKYECMLKNYGLGSSVLAYRRIPSGAGKSGKCNIHFARDAILEIRRLGNCCVVALDISNFFETLDHDRLKSLWCGLLGVSRLPPDHFRVFEAVTSYSFVEQKAVYERLGHFGVKKMTKTGKPINGYLTRHKDMPKQLCTGKEFREKIAGGDGSKSIIKKNLKPYGIPQGAPISDLLANLYLLDFDKQVLSWVRAVGGSYFRYSDDILIIVPGVEADGRQLMHNMQALIREFGSQLQIKEEKTAIVVFLSLGCHAAGGQDQNFRRVHGTQGRNGFEYLGFRYDGKRVYIRDSTLSNLRRKVARAARRAAHACARRYPDKDADQLRSLFDYERLMEKYGKVVDFYAKRDDYRNWTFWTYAKRSAQIFGPLGAAILRQLKRHRKLVRERVNEELDLAVVRRGK